MTETSEDSVQISHIRSLSASHTCFKCPSTKIAFLYIDQYFIFFKLKNNSFYIYICLVSNLIRNEIWIISDGHSFLGQASFYIYLYISEKERVEYTFVVADTNIIQGAKTAFVSMGIVVMAFKNVIYDREFCKQGTKRNNFRYDLQHILLLHPVILYIVRQRQISSFSRYSPTFCLHTKHPDQLRLRLIAQIKMLVKAQVNNNIYHSLAKTRFSKVYVTGDFICYVV